ncbi:MAG: hypothetical protein HXK16_03490 [Alloprevotella sp.]|nr:hypothetical protein [Alloprevotella sp.]
MKYLLPLALAFLPTLSQAQKPNDVQQAVVRVVTFNEKGDTLHTTYGYFASPTAEVVAPYAAFRGATRAVVTDTKGRQADVLRIVAASDNYDMVRVTTAMPTKKLPFLTRSTAVGAAGTAWQQTFFSTEKQAQPLATNVLSADANNVFPYYTLSAPNEEQYVGCPIVDNGQVVAIAQRNLLDKAQGICAISAAVADSFRVNAAAALNSDFNAIRIPKQLPTSENDAYSYFFMMLRTQRDSLQVLPLIQDFTTAYPKNGAAMLDLASYYARQRQYAEADAWLQRRFTLGGDGLDAVYDTQAQLIYEKALADSTNYPTWNLEAALKAAEKSYALQAKPAALLQQGVILYSMKRDEQALEKFKAYNASPAASPQSHYFAAQVLMRMKVADSLIVAELDKALEIAEKPYKGGDVAAVLELRAYYNEKLGNMRAAVLDYNDYEQIVGSQSLSAQFFAIRAALAEKARIYQVALDDYSTAISRASTKEEREDYRINRALLCLRVQLWDDAIATAQQTIAENPQAADAYKIIGVAYGEQKNRARALEYLTKAQQLGDENATTLLQKYSALPATRSASATGRTTAPAKRGSAAARKR